MICSIASALLVFIVGSEPKWVVVAFFIPQLILSLVDSAKKIILTQIKWKGFINILSVQFYMHGL